ncbi:MAG TPA: hypothetical protein VGM46_12075 [Mesorhizobium sp.]
MAPAIADGIINRCQSPSMPGVLTNLLAALFSICEQSGLPSLKLFNPRCLPVRNDSHGLLSAGNPKRNAKRIDIAAADCDAADALGVLADVSIEVGASRFRPACRGAARQCGGKNCNLKRFHHRCEHTADPRFGKAPMKTGEGTDDGHDRHGSNMSIVPTAAKTVAATSRHRVMLHRPDAEL